VQQARNLLMDLGERAGRFRTLPEGDLVGARLSHARIGHPIRPGRALLNTGDATLATITVPAG